MEARVKEGGPPYPVTAFGGQHYHKHQWTPVPAEAENEARAHPMLDVREAPEPEPEPAAVDATDAARELAAEHGIDLAGVTGTGEDGRVLVADVRALVEEEA